MVQGLTPPGYVLPPPSGAQSIVVSRFPGADAAWLRAAAPIGGSIDRRLAVSRGCRRLATCCRPLSGLNRSSFRGFQGLPPPGYVLPPLRGLNRLSFRGFQGLTAPGYVLPPLRGLNRSSFRGFQGLPPPGYVLLPPVGAESIVVSCGFAGLTRPGFVMPPLRGLESDRSFRGFPGGAAAWLRAAAPCGG